MTAITTYPNRVWEKHVCLVNGPNKCDHSVTIDREKVPVHVPEGGGWVSRPVTPEDIERRNQVAMKLTGTKGD